MRGLLVATIALVGCAPQSKTSTAYVYGSEGSGYATVVETDRTDPASASAGQIGCTPDQIQIVNDDVTGDTRTWLATCQGKTYSCSHGFQGPTTCTSTGESTLKPPQESGSDGMRDVVRSAHAPSVPPPKGAAGFDFGQTQAGAEEKCRAADADWRVSKRAALCSAAPKPIGLRAQAGLTFCNGKACEIEVIVVPDGGSGAWSSTFTSLAKALRDKYGSPNRERRLVPVKCRSMLKQCLEHGNASLQYLWIWSAQKQVTLEMGQTGEGASIRIRYFDVPQDAKAKPAKVNTDAL